MEIFTYPCFFFNSFSTNWLHVINGLSSQVDFALQFSNLDLSKAGMIICSMSLEALRSLTTMGKRSMLIIWTILAGVTFEKIRCHAFHT